MKNKKGIIRISSHLLRGGLAESWSALTAVFSKFIPIRIEPDFDSCIYHGYSSEFDELGEAEAVPEYTATITTVNEDAGQRYVVNFKRI